MAAEEVKRFLAALEADAVLRDKVERAVGGSADRIAAIGAVARLDGYQFGDEELKAALEGMSRELSEDELSKVAGGVGTFESAFRATSPLSISPSFLGTMKDA